jgi:hypothetical protein
VNGWQVLRLLAGRGSAVARMAGRWSAAALVVGDALVDAAVDLGADPLDQTRRYRVVILGAEVTVRSDRRGDFLIPARVHKLKIHPHGEIALESYLSKVMALSVRNLPRPPAGTSQR